ncbi:MAG: cytochrome-c peroxidase [Flavobacteriales bacterium]|nr:cytochrome-c peroxidase [Flavobacteriales bacterium]
MRTRVAVILVVVVGGLAGCAKDAGLEPAIDDTYHFSLPEGFSEVPVPADNPMTKSKVALGKRLFFEKILSKDSTVSCGTCHKQAIAFADDRQLSEGVDGGTGFRNAPTLANLAYSPFFFMDGGVPTLEIQVLAPIQGEVEMNLNMLEAVQRLQQHPEYPALFREVFGREPDAFGLSRALAAFERTLISGDSRVDQYHFQGDKNALTPSEIRGMDIFNSAPANCASCHSGFRFTNDQFENNGLYLTYVDTGRARITLKDSDVGRFRVPTLRNVALTPPYMHDGSLATLEDVVEHYVSGGQPHRNKSSLIQGFSLTTQQKKDLVNFLEALTDTRFINNFEYMP